MSRLVIDASVLIKLFVSEDGSREVASAVKKADELLAPELLLAEIGNILWKYVRRNDLTAADANQILAEMMQMPIQFTATSELIEAALKLAIETDRTVYDCLYLALAVHSKEMLLTADERFVNALAVTAWGKHVQLASRPS
ncbi:MAG: type II toxin-antitoxin system VapC family toxin [Planctomycetes bacterium]|nr:type II toxin-antitoxin system VapC family toxin [Planctomycetota bacterium]